MSAPAALKAVSHREALSKTVRLLTRDGIAVQFRGHQPHVATKGNKAIRLVLPELNDSASPELLEAIQGYLDHEVGHIFYTPFARATKAGAADPKAPALLNIVEDIRLEKLLPRGNDKVQAMPGTKENLERMYEKFIPNMIHPATQKAVETGNPGKAFAGVMVPALRALAGQKAFQEYMDSNNYWPHFMPLIVKMPDISRRLKAMETFDDVEAIVLDIIAAMAPPEKKADSKPESGDEDSDTPRDNDAPDDNGDDDRSSSSDESDPADDGEESEDSASDDGDSDESDEGDGHGHGDGSGTDDGEGDEDDDQCSGDGDDAGDDKSESDAPQDSQSDDGEGKESDKPGNGGKNNTTITDALKQLEPTQRKALFMYKQRKQSVATIANEMQRSEDDVLDLLRNARRRLGEIMKGARS